MSPRRLVHLSAVGCALLLWAAVGAAAESTRPESVEPGASVPSGPPPPAGVRFGETLEGKRLRLGYSWERVRFEGLATRHGHVTADYVRDVLGYPSVPRSLDVTVHTFEVAFAPHPRVTLVAELPVLKKELERVDTQTPGPCNSVVCEFQADGVGDFRIAMIVPFIRKGFESSQIHIGFGAPTGAIRRQGGTDRRLPYLAQVGNGSWDFEWGWTYKGELERIAWGGQVLGYHPLNRNGLNYRRGSRFTGRLWLAIRLFAEFDLTLRTEWEKENEIDGFDRSLQPSLDPTEDADRYDRSTIRVAPGLSLPVPFFPGQRVGVEFAFPVYQDLDGPQLEEDWGVKAAWRWVY